MTDNRQIAQVLREIADLLEIKGENAFRIRSYRMGADSIESHGQDVAGMVRRGEDPRTIDGVGEGIAGKLKEIVASGSCAFHRDLLVEVPVGLLELLELPGLGPKGVSLVWRKLGVTSAADLEAAIADGRFRTLPGMKEKKEARIRKGLEVRRQKQKRFLLPLADQVVGQLSAYLREHGAMRIEAAGSYRRRRETVGDIDLIVVGDAPKLSNAFVAHPNVQEILGNGEAKSSVVLNSGLQVDLRPFAPESLGAALQYFTGSKAHNVALRERAIRRGLKLNEYGVFRTEDGERIAGDTEGSVYAALGLPLIPPEMREDRGEIAAAEGELLSPLVELGDLQGDLHSHTTESDGRDSLEAMVEGARAKGLKYLAITDHSRAIPSQTHGTGMDEKRCLDHIQRIRKLGERLDGFTLLAGIEVDILPDGRLDMSDEVLAQLDVVVASLHSRLNMEAPEMTDRVLRAFSSPHLHIWGHPLARLILKRDPVSIDVERVLDEAALRGIAVEVNGQPDRLDLPDAWIRAARDKGVRFVISSDSHSVHALDNLGYGVGQARRGWLRPGDVLNTLDVRAFRAALRPGAGVTTPR